MNIDNLIEHVCDVPCKDGEPLRYLCNTGSARDMFAHDPALTLVDVQWMSYAWPGGHQIHYITEDGGTLCHECANEEFMRTIDPEDEQFYIIGADTHWEGEPLHCDHCNREITPEYEGEEEGETQ